MTMDARWILLILVAFVGSSAHATELRHPLEELPGLASASTVFLDLRVRGPHHSTLPRRISTLFTQRMADLAYTVVAEEKASHDVTVRLTCEESSQDAVEENGPIPQSSTHFQRIGRQEAHGPPCVFAYRYRGRTIPWQRIDRIVYSEGVKAARVMGSEGSRSLGSRVLRYLEEYDFPLLLAAEWGHSQRLVSLFNHPETAWERKKQIIMVLAEIRAEAAFPLLTKSLAEPQLTVDAAHALGHFGERARPFLTALLRSSNLPSVQSAAAHGLGQIGAMTGDTRSTPLLLDVLTTPGLNRRVQTEIVWALGKAPDFSAFPILEKLERELWLIRSDDPDLEGLRQAVDWSIREVRQGGHTDDY